MCCNVFISSSKQTGRDFLRHQRLLLSRLIYLSFHAIVDSCLFHCRKRAVITVIPLCAFSLASASHPRSVYVPLASSASA